ncbi:hypothetical protein AB0I53_23700 [Saccharopolyspora sp. NPDC050389]|uniref:hypothetical protein n=1 Tax=Saccharopolyspora sp. NPDC050389 TaxID=3155516 RepID=UPI0033C24B0B
MTDSFRFEGRAEVGSLLGILFSKLDYLDYHTDVGEGATRVVGFHGRSNGIEFEEYLVLSFDEQHRIRHAVVAVRGMSGLALIFSTIGPDLLRMHHSRWGAGLARFGLPIITRAVVAMERWLLPLAEPNRDRA